MVLKMVALEEEAYRNGLLSRAFFKQWSGISLPMISYSLLEEGSGQE